MLMEQGCNGVALFGTTGEGAEFSVDDRIATLKDLAISTVDPDRLVVSVGALAIPDVVKLADNATNLGVHGVLLMPPCVYRSGIDESGTFRYFATVIERIGRSDLRLYLYHFPDISGVPITPQVVRRLDERYPGIIAGVKDSGGDIDYTLDLVRRFSHLSIFTGSENHLPELLTVGARGTICGLANVMPRLLREMIDCATAFDRRALLPHLLACDTILSRRPFIPSAKAIVADIMCDPEWRRVLPPMTEILAIERQRMVADFAKWDAGLPTEVQSLTHATLSRNNIVDLRRA